MSESHFAAEPGILWVSLMAGPPPPDPWGMGVGGKDQHPPGRRWSAGADQHRAGMRETLDSQMTIHSPFGAI